MTSAATGSARHQPSQACRPTPRSAAAEVRRRTRSRRSRRPGCGCRLPFPVRRLAMARAGMTISAAAVMARPGWLAGRGLGGQVVDALCREVGGEGEERHADQPDGPGFAVLAGSPRTCQMTMAADSSISESRPKPPGRSSGRDPGGDGDGGLGDHPGDAGVLEPEAPPPQTAHIGPQASSPAPACQIPERAAEIAGLLSQDAQQFPAGLLASAAGLRLKSCPVTCGLVCAL